MHYTSHYRGRDARIYLASGLRVRMHSSWEGEREGVRKVCYRVGIVSIPAPKPNSKQE